MNKIVLVGRLTKDPVIDKTSSGISFTRFNVACKGKQRDENNEPKVDFFVCVAWRQLADIIVKYCKKGSLLQLSGTMGSRSYEKQDGTKQTVWEVTLEDMEFLSSNEETGDKKGKPVQQRLLPIEDGGECPF